MTYTCVIIDDEPDAHIVLKHHIKKRGNIELLAEFGNAGDALNFFKKNTVDFILLDIDMPEISGFGFLSLLDHKPKIIFTTAYSDFALQSFEYNVIDYLLKPISFIRFSAAMDKLENNNLRNRILPEFIKLADVGVSINPYDIIYVESFGNYVKIHLENQTVITHSTMQKISQILLDYGFLRIHKRYAINVKKVFGTVSDKVVLSNNASLPVGISYRQMVSITLQK
jgi:two-component system, LytTR family, response regulator